MLSLSESLLRRNYPITPCTTVLCCVSPLTQAGMIEQELPGTPSPLRAGQAWHSPMRCCARRGGESEPSKISRWDPVGPCGPGPAGPRTVTNGTGWICHVTPAGRSRGGAVVRIKRRGYW